MYRPHNDGEMTLLGPICACCPRAAAPGLEVCAEHDVCGECQASPTLDGKHCEWCVDHLCGGCGSPSATVMSPGRLCALCERLQREATP
jgi:hypothetical protein